MKTCSVWFCTVGPNTILYVPATVATCERAVGAQDAIGYCVRGFLKDDSASIKSYQKMQKQMEAAKCQTDAERAKRCALAAVSLQQENLRNPARAEESAAAK